MFCHKETVFSYKTPCTFEDYVERIWKDFSAVLTVHDHPMCIVFLDVLSTVGETFYGIVINVISNAYWATEGSLHHVRQRAMDQLNSSLVSRFGIAAIVNSSGSGGAGAAAGNNNSSNRRRSRCSGNSNNSNFFSNVCTSVIIFLIYRKLYWTRDEMKSH